MDRNIRSAWVLAWAICALPGSSGADPGNSGTLAEAIRTGTWDLALRYRFEEVYDDGVGDEAALASTLRTAIGYRSGAWYGLRLRIEGEDVRAFDDSRYNNAGFGGSANGVRDRPVVADPEGSALQRAALSWGRGPVVVSVGRDELNLGDQRFVGAVGWRQHHQSFDSATVSVRASDRVRLFYAYLDKVRRINRAVDDLEGHLLRGEFALGAAGKLAVYAVRLDYDDTARAGLSSSTWGAEWSGERAAGGGSFGYEVELARQRDAGSNPGRIDAGYSFLSLGYKGARTSLRAGWETLDGNARDGQFQTPLATLHKFNGWADRFLVTPRDGLVDAFVEVGWRAGKATWTAAWHEFDAASGGAGYGEELDAQLLFRATGALSFGLKLANYEAGSFGADARKLWFWSTCSF